METQNNKLNDLDRLLFEEVDKANPSEDVIKQLVLQGANINAYDTEDNVILTFLESVNDRFNWYGDSETSNKFPDEHDFKILQTILELGADPNSITLFDDRNDFDTDYPCLYEAAITCSYRLVELLIQYGAKVQDYLIYDIVHWVFNIAEEFEIGESHDDRPNEHKLRNAKEMLNIFQLFIEKGYLSQDAIDYTKEQIQYLKEQIVKLHNYINSLELEEIKLEIETLKTYNDDFVTDFMPKFFELNGNSWTFALLNPRENTFLQITTSGNEDTLTKTIKWLENYLDTKQKISISIDDKTFIIEPAQEERINFYITVNNEIVFYSNAYEHSFIHYFYQNWFDFIFQETDFDLPYFGKDITQIKSDKLGLYSIDYSEVDYPIDFNAFECSASRWKDADNLRKAKWCLLAAKTNRVLQNGIFKYCIDGKILENNDIKEYISNMDRVISLMDKTAVDFSQMCIGYGYAEGEYTDYTKGKKFWDGSFDIKIELCGIKNVEVYIGGGGDYYYYLSEQEVYAQFIASILFCSRGLDQALW